MREFGYERLASASDLAERPDGAIWLAGGQSLLPAMKARKTTPSRLIDIKAALPRAITRTDAALTIGAGATHAMIAEDPMVRAAIPALSELASHVGDPSVRHRGTLGGSLAVDHPAGDWPAAAIALNAILDTTEGKIAFEEARRDGLRGAAILNATFAIPDAAVYVKFLHPAQRYAIVGAMLALFGNSPRLVVTGLSKTGAFCWEEMENHLGGAERTYASVPLPPGLNVRSDHFAGAGFRSAIAAELAHVAFDASERGEVGTKVIVHGKRMNEDP